MRSAHLCLASATLLYLGCSQPQTPTLTWSIPDEVNQGTQEAAEAARAVAALGTDSAYQESKRAVSRDHPQLYRRIQEVEAGTYALLSQLSLLCRDLRRQLGSSTLPAICDTTTILPQCETLCFSALGRCLRNAVRQGEDEYPCYDDLERCTMGCQRPQ